ncbi:MAG: hypothetical protein ABIG60_05330 [Patescibacteria group bacterium]
MTKNKQKIRKSSTNKDSIRGIIKMKEIVSQLEKTEDQIKKKKFSAKDKDNLSDALDKLSDKVDDLSSARKIPEAKGEAIKERISEVKNLLDTDDDDGEKNSKEFKNDEKEVKKILTNLDEVEAEIKKGFSIKRKDKLSDILEEINDSVEKLNDDERISDVKTEELKEKISKADDLLDRDDDDDSTDTESAELEKITSEINEIEKKIKSTKITNKNKDNLSDALDTLGDKVEDLNDDGKLSDSDTNALKQKIGEIDDILDTEDKE